ncbi:hypothetical protein DFJ67_8162 [Asanoa ferruginea]|uniref:Uncharacterized protein n=1 Tax=Asanoa ferruginea TaxID=53367 RepID=A0A3E0A6C6_9ACTN|nr:hypothetical protein [Asanoa ferruginea]REG02071.1 hypothetical protein DFJ67_8162 [Asanoa ferruginea]GIF48635.1 hypothetical protein Afe04nite_31740 [Asanoa ferruginea]
MGQDGWRRSDAWIFVAVVMANGAGRHMRSATTRRPEGVRLADVLSMADHLRQSLPDRREVEEAVRRLTGAGLITVGDGWFRVTPAGEVLWRARPVGMGAVDSLFARLQRRPLPVDADWTLDDADHAAAILEYAGRVEPTED